MRSMRLKCQSDAIVSGPNRPVNIMRMEISLEPTDSLGVMPVDSPTRAEGGDHFEQDVPERQRRLQHGNGCAGYRDHGQRQQGDDSRLTEGLLRDGVVESLLALPGCRSVYAHQQDEEGAGFDTAAC